MLKIFYQNVRGLRTKTVQFKQRLSISSGDLHCITESWLNEGFRSTELCDDNVNIFRRDRHYVASNSSRGGGVLVITNHSLLAERIVEFETSLDKLEDIWIRVRLSDGRWIYLCTVYISPFSGNDYLYESFLDKLTLIASLIASTDEIIVVGDLNCPEISGFFSGANPQTNLGRTDQSILNAASFCNFAQYNNISYSNEQFTILDLVLANAHKANILVNRSPDPLVTPDTYHPPLCISVTISPMLSNTNPFMLNFRKANYARINQELAEVDWDQLHLLSVDDATSYFYSIIESAISNHVPHSKHGRRYPQWFSPDLITCIKKKNKLHRVSKRNHAQVTHEAYRLARSACKTKCEEDYNKYIQELQVSMATNIKKYSGPIPK